MYYLILHVSLGLSILFTFLLWEHSYYVLLVKTYWKKKRYLSSILLSFATILFSATIGSFTILLLPVFNFFIAEELEKQKIIII